MMAIDHQDTAGVNAKTHKRSARPHPKLTLILLDWSTREKFFALEWLNRQDIDRESFEILWIELYDRIAPEALERADGVYTCAQQGIYHKHKGYNLGLLESRGALICVCDSDAIFPVDFISSILARFDDGNGRYKSQVLMHYEYRTEAVYPVKGISKLDELANYQWKNLWENVGACMTIRREDAIRFGGFDEDKRYRGYICGPYDLGWRLVNAGLPEIWHDPSVALYHFAHPDPTATTHAFSLKRWREIAYPHFEGHAALAVLGFCTGRLLPFQENSTIRECRLQLRQIGSELEKCVAALLPVTGYAWRHRAKLFIWPVIEVLRLSGWVSFRRLVRSAIGEQRYKWLKTICGRPIEQTQTNKNEGREKIT